MKYQRNNRNPERIDITSNWVHASEHVVLKKKQLKSVLTQLLPVLNPKAPQKQSLFKRKSYLWISLAILPWLEPTFKRLRLTAPYHLSSTVTWTETCISHTSLDFAQKGNKQIHYINQKHYWHKNRHNDLLLENVVYSLGSTCFLIYYSSQASVPLDLYSYLTWNAQIRHDYCTLQPWWPPVRPA